MTATATRPADGTPPTRHSVQRPSAPRDPSATRRTLLALLASGLGVLPLKGLINDWGWLLDVWLTMIVVVAPAALLRRRRPPGALDIWPGVLLAVPWLTLRFVHQHALAGLIPTTATWHDVGRLMDDLHRTTRDEVAPVHSTMAIRLVLCALLGLLAALIDLITIVGRRGALGGVPLLVVYTVSGAVPRQPVSWVWFVFAAGAFLLLLAVDADDELGRWGRRIGRPGGGRTPLPVPISAQRIAAVAIVVAIVVPFLVPDQPRNLIADAFHHSNGNGNGDGFGSGGGISPFANLKGQLERNTPSNVMTVTMTGGPTADPPGYLRSNVLDEYTGSGWREGDHGDTESLGGDYPTDPPTVAPRNRRYSARIKVANLGGDAPLFPVPTSLEGLDSDVKWNPQDQLLLGRNVHNGDDYNEVFTENTPSASDLRNSTNVYAADMSRWLAINVDIPESVTGLVDRLTAGKRTPYDRARAITDYFANPASGFQYSLKTKGGDSGNDLVDFLKAKIGFCQQYAAATAIMFRLARIPSRVVLGWMHPTVNAKGQFTITSFDAHAWVEAYFAGIGWVPFDTTPIDGLDGGQKADFDYAPHNYPSANDPGVVKSRTAGGSSSAGAASTAPSSSGPVTSTAVSPSTDRTPLWVTLGALIVLALALAPGGVRVGRRRRRLAAARYGDPDPLWAELADTVVDLGYVWSPARSPRQVASWLGRDTGDPAALDALARAVEHQRYGPVVTGQDTAELSRGLARVTAQLRARRSNAVRLRARFWPASLGIGALRLGPRGGKRRR